MKYFLVIFLVLAACTCFAWESTSYKFGYVYSMSNGISAGLKMPHSKRENKEVFLCADYFFAEESGLDYKSMMSLYTEISSIYDNNFYSSYSIGLLYKLDDYINSERMIGDVYLKLTAGLGYLFPIDDGIFIFTEVNGGFQYYTLNAKLGVKF